MNKEIDAFINELKQIDSIPEYTNQYSEKTKDHEITTHNLRLYLNSIYERKLKYIFVGEAPSYRGCRITGIPFTSEFIIRRNKFFNVKNSYKIINKNKPIKESTATMIWQYFNERQLVPFLWNAFPFHPRKTGNNESNRRPNSRELDIGQRYIIKLLDIFNVKHVVSIGKVANKILNKTKIDNTYVRHPSHGGKNDFISGMDNFINGGKDHV
jgi:uracil-DNA glycosylase